MTTHRQTMTQAFQRLEQGDLDGCQAMMSDDFVANLAGSPQPQVGRNAWRSSTEYLLGAFSGLRVDLDDCLSDDDRIMCRVTLSATHTGEFLGRSATGRAVRWESYEIYRISGGLIREEWICSDLLGLLSQIEP